MGSRIINSGWGGSVSAVTVERYERELPVVFFLRLKEGFEELGDLLGAVCGLCVTNGALVRT